MAINSTVPYIHFNGTAQQAIELYKEALGATVQHMMRYAEGPCVNSTPENKDRIMHAELRIGGGQVMVNDAPSDRPATAGGNMEIALDFSDLDKMTKAFDSLAEGGKVVMSLQDTFWGARFGTLTDRYGVRWMFNCQLQAAGANG